MLELSKGKPTSVALSTDNAASKKPVSLLGISTYLPKINESQLSEIESRFLKHSKCELCGASLTKEMRHNYYGDDLGWFNACSMCFYPQNLDLIPYFERGDVLYFPSMEQSRFNALLRAVWSVDTFNKTGVSSNVFQEFRHSMVDLIDKVNGQLHGMEYYFETTSVDILVATLDLLKPEQYAERHKLLANFKWFPKREIFKNEITYWAQQDFNMLHPAKIDDNITQFVSNYAQRTKS